jgi:hypothetical protein
MKNMMKARRILRGVLQGPLNEASRPNLVAVLDAFQGHICDYIEEKETVAPPGSSPAEVLALDSALVPSSPTLKRTSVPSVHVPGDIYPPIKELRQRALDAQVSISDIVPGDLKSKPSNAQKAAIMARLAEKIGAGVEA